MDLKVNKIIKEDPDPRKTMYELEETKTRTDTFGISIETLEKQRARFQSTVDNITAKIVLLEQQ